MGVKILLIKYKKHIANAVFLIALLFITFRGLLKDQELSRIMGYIHHARKVPLISGVLLVFVFICCESLIIHYLMRKLDSEIPMRHCIKYSFIGFFYSAVTPSATGGQPMQVYYMKRDNVNIAESSLVLIIITIVYKVVLLLLGVLAIFSQFGIIRDNVGGFRILLIYGITANVLFVAFLLIIVFRQSFAKRTIVTVILWLGKHRLIRRYDRFLKRTFTALSKYDSCAEYVKKNPGVFLYVFIITLVQRISLFIVTFLVYKAFRLHGTSIHEIVAMQTVIALAADSLPLPGGIGVTENSFIVLFDRIFGEKLVIPGMLLSRGLTYYLLLIISAAVTIAAHLFGKRKTKKEWENQ